MQTPTPFTSGVAQSKYLKAFLLAHPEYRARYAECVDRVTTWTKTALHKAYPHEYNSLRSRRQSGKPFDPRLRDIRNWLIHLGPRPAKGWTVDEVAHGKGYIVNNCRWAMRNDLQLSNRKVTKWHSMPDGQRLLTKQLAAYLGITRNALGKQLRKGRNVHELIDKYQKHRGLHAWQFPEHLLHVVEPLYRKRTRRTQSRLEWLIAYLERFIDTHYFQLTPDERPLFEQELERAMEARNQIIYQQEQEAAAELQAILAALSAFHRPK